MEQRTDEWFDIRKGRFTASPILRLLGNGKRAMTEEELAEYKKQEPKGRRTTIDTYGDGLVTYAKEKAIETVFGLDPDDELDTWDMKRGRELEPLAFRRFKEIKELDFIEVQECGFFPYGKHAGASPDGLVGDDAVLEIKCPRRNKFFTIVADGKDAIDPEYYAQMQMQMLSTNSVRAHFFNYYVENGLEHWHEIIIDRDDEMIALIKERIKIATKIKMEYIKKLNKNRQW